MTVVVIFIFVLLLLLLLLSTSDLDFIQPGNIACLMTLLSVLVLSMFVKKLNIDLSASTVFLVMGSLICICIGSFIAPSRIDRITLLDTPSFYSKKVIWFSLIFILLSTVLYYREVLRIAKQLGFSSSSAYSMIYYYRTATLSGGEEIASQSKVVGQLVVASFGIAYLLLIDFAKRVIYKVQNNFWTFSLPEILGLLIFLVQCILSGGRTQFLYFVESTLFTFVFLYTKKNGKYISGNIIRRILIVIIITFVAFYSLGSLTGKTEVFDPSLTLFAYIGAPIAAFDKLIRHEVYFNSTFWGSNVFWGIADILRRLGFKVDPGKLEAPFVSIGGVQTNIYGAFGRYYADFGWIGVLVFPFLIGIIYQIAYVRLQRTNSDIEEKLAIYLLCSQVLFDFCIEERFFTSVISLGTLLRVLYIILFYTIFNRIKVRLVIQS